MPTSFIERIVAHEDNSDEIGAVSSCPGTKPRPAVRAVVLQYLGVDESKDDPGGVDPLGPYWHPLRYT